MQKQTGTFNAIGNSDARMFGDTALLVSGYNIDEQQRLQALLANADVHKLPLIFVDAPLKDHTLAELASAPEKSAAGRDSTLRRAIVMSGLTESELHTVMKAYRRGGLPQPLWASMTPISAEWTLHFLLEELGKEKDELRKAMAVKRAQEAAARAPGEPTP